MSLAFEAFVIHGGHNDNDPWAGRAAELLKLYRQTLIFDCTLYLFTVFNTESVSDAKSVSFIENLAALRERRAVNPGRPAVDKDILDIVRILGDADTTPDIIDERFSTIERADEDFIAEQAWTVTRDPLLSIRQKSQNTSRFFFSLNTLLKDASLIRIIEKMRTEARTVDSNTYLQESSKRAELLINRMAALPGDDPSKIEISIPAIQANAIMAGQRVTWRRALLLAPPPAGLRRGILRLAVDNTF